MSVCALNLAPYGLQVKYFGVTMGSNTRVKKTNTGKLKRVSRSHHGISIASLRIRYSFWILLGILVLAGIAMVMRIETPVVWTFLYGVGGWAALTNNLGRNLK